MNQDSDMNTLLMILKKMRFAGRVTRIGPDYGFVLLDDTTLDVFIHRDICGETVPWNTVKVGDRLRFGVKESKLQPGKLVAGHVTRETKI
jgi:hypothetical protein